MTTMWRALLIPVSLVAFVVGVAVILPVVDRGALVMGAPGPLGPTATHSVTSTADSGVGTLGQALLDAQSGDTILFDPSVFPPASPVTITLNSVLPEITQGNLVIDASDAGVVLDGSLLADDGDQGLRIVSDGNTIYGLQVVNMPSDGIFIQNADGTTIGGDRATGAGLLGHGNLVSGNGGQGIRVSGDSSGTVILGNFIGTTRDGLGPWGNAGSGVMLGDAPGPQSTAVGGSTATTVNVIGGNQEHGISVEAGSSGNHVGGNLIGVGVDGITPIGNGGRGVSVSSAPGNTIGGGTTADRNIITYNDGDGVGILGSGADQNTIQGNWIGVDADGPGGIEVRDLVVADDGTVFIADYGRGVVRSTDGATSWQVPASGPTSEAIEHIAVSPDFASTQTVWAWGERTLYKSTDGGAGWSTVVGVLDCAVNDIAVSPNYAVDQGLLAAIGASDEGNCTPGILWSADGGATWSQVSTVATSSVEFSPKFASDRTILAACESTGILRSTDGGAVWQNSNTGLASVGITAIAFAPDGQSVFATTDSCSEPWIYASSDGGESWLPSSTSMEDCGAYWVVSVSPAYATNQTVLGARDLVYRTTDQGVHWTEITTGTFGTRAEQVAFAPNDPQGLVAYFANFSGVFKTTDGGASWAWGGANLADPGNGGDGIRISDGAGKTDVIGNVVARNAYQGIRVSSVGPEGSVIRNNIVGLGPDGQTRAGNGAISVVLSTSYITVTGNTIAAGGGGGIRSFLTDLHDLVIADNYIGTDVSGTTAVGNHYHGISLKSYRDTIRDNLVSGNRATGIALHASVTGTLVAGNMVGTDSTGTQALPNEGDGVWLAGHNSTVGGCDPGDRNILSGNTAFGLAVYGDNNVVIGNYIGTDMMGVSAIPNSSQGLSLGPGADGNRVGGSQSCERNLISGNDSIGVSVYGADNVLSGNFIGTDAGGEYALGNRSLGIYVGDSATGNRIGGVNTSTIGKCEGECNVVSGNHESAIHVSGSGTTSNIVTGNFVGTTVDGQPVLGNGDRGVYIGNGASLNIVGGPSTTPGVCNGKCNLLADNGRYGVEVAGVDTLQNTISQNSIYGNGVLGIQLSDGANIELPAPVITASDMSAGTVAGTACANCVVEVFSDDHGEGRWYEGAVVAGENGIWFYAKGEPLRGPEISATATDPAGDTSEFGQDWPADPPPAPVVAWPPCGTTSALQPRFRGFSQMGSSVQLLVEDVQVGMVYADSTNRWAIAPSMPIADGARAIMVTASSIWGYSNATVMTLTVDSSLCYDPAGVLVAQDTTVQHPQDSLGCVGPERDLQVTLWPSSPVTISVPVAASAVSPYVEVDAVRYALTDDDADGLYTATFDAPSSDSEIQVGVTCAGSIQTLAFGAVIDEAGYVYDAIATAGNGITETIAGVTVTLNAYDAVRNKWVLWDAELYDQENPQVTQFGGHFSFFTPPGEYKVVADGARSGYNGYESPVLTVTDGPVRRNVALLPVEGGYTYFPLIRR